MNVFLIVNLCQDVAGVVRGGGGGGPGAVQGPRPLSSQVGYNTLDRLLSLIALQAPATGGLWVHSSDPAGERKPAGPADDRAVGGGAGADAEQDDAGDRVRGAGGPCRGDW